MSKSGISSSRALTATLVAVILFSATATAQLLLGAGDGRKPSGGGGGNDCSGTGTIALDTAWASGGGSWQWDGGTAGAVYSFPATSITGSNLVLVAGVATYQGETVVGMKWNTTESLTKITSVAGAVESQTQDTELWYLKAPTTGSHKIDVTFSSAPTFAAGVAVSYTGVNQTTPIFSFNTGVNNSTSTAETLGTTATGGNNCWLSGIIFRRAGSGPTAGAGTTARVGQGDDITNWDSNGGVTAGTPQLAWTGGAGTTWPGKIVAAIAPTP